MVSMNKKSFLYKSLVLFGAFSILFTLSGVNFILATEHENSAILEKEALGEGYFEKKELEDNYNESIIHEDKYEEYNFSDDFQYEEDIKQEEDYRYEEERRRQEEFQREEDRRYEEEQRQREEERHRQEEFQREEEQRKSDEEFWRKKDEEDRRQARLRAEEDKRKDEEFWRQREEEERKKWEEKEREYFEKERFHQMKRDLSHFTREINRMEREIARTKKRFERCDLPIPSWTQDNIVEARSIAAKIEAAQTAEELEDLMLDIDEVGFNMQDWGPEMGSLHQLCDMLSGAKRELKRLERNQERMEKKVEQRGGAGVKAMLAKLREIQKKMKSAVDEAIKLANTDPEEAIFILEDEFFFKLEDYYNAQRGIEMALDVARGLKDADREIREFEQRIAELKEDGEETSRLEDLLDEMRAIKKKIEAITARGGFEPEEIDDLIEEAFDIREEIIALLKHKEEGHFFQEDEDSIGKEFEEEGFDIPDSFAPSARRKAIIESGAKGKAADTQVQKIKEKAEFLMEGKLDSILAELQELRSVVKEQEAEIKFLTKLSSEFKKINNEMKEKLNAFVAYGVDENSKKLGAGERAAVLHSFESAYGALPDNEKDVEDMVKIVNGRFPSQRSSVAEKQARRTFQEIFKRVANLNNPNDKAAIMVMAYGLRQTAQNRNLESEKKGIETFRAIFNKVPQTTDEWNTMQAITYSGAVRKADRDKDLLADVDEELFGADPDNADTDGDGILDGVEVDEGFDPLQ